MPKSNSKTARGQSKSSAQKQSQAAKLKEGRHGLAVLKQKGLFSGDVRNAKLGWRQKQLLKNFSDVISGDALVVKVPKLKGEARQRFEAVPKASTKSRGSARRKNNRIVAPKKGKGKGERARYDAKTGAIVSTVTYHDGRFRRFVLPHPITSVDQIPSEIAGRKVMFGLHSKYGRGIMFDDPAEFRAFLATYPKKKEEDLLPYLEILEALDDGDDYEGEE